MQYIVYFGSIVAAFNIIDTLSRDEDKAALSSYLFGASEIKIKNSVKLIALYITSCFYREGKMKLSRVLIWSIFSAPIILSITWHMVKPAIIILYEISENTNSDNAIDPQLSYRARIVVISLLILLSTPIYVLNIWVTNRLYTSRSTITHKITAACDFILSASCTFIFVALYFMAPAGLFFLIIYAQGPLNNFLFFVPDIYVFFVGGGIFLSIFIISFIRVTVFSFGLMLRLLSYWIHLNKLIAARSKVRDYPFTFIGVIVAIASIGRQNL